MTHRSEIETEILTAATDTGSNALSLALLVLGHVIDAADAETNGEAHVYYQTPLDTAVALVNNYSKTTHGLPQKLERLRDAINDLEISQ